MQILLDMDGVLVDFNKTICERFDLPYPPKIYNFFEDIRLQVDAICNMDFWANLKWMPDGHDILGAILKRVNPEQIYLLSCPMSNIYSASGKMAWIHKNLPMYESRTIITSISKSFFATSDRLLIDDKNENVDKFRAAGGMAILYPRSWNKLHAINNPFGCFQRDFRSCC